MRTVFKFHTEANAWSTLAPMPHSCSHNCVSVVAGLVYIIGAGGNYREVLLFDPWSGAWVPLAPTLLHGYNNIAGVLVQQRRSKRNQPSHMIMLYTRLHVPPADYGPWVRCCPTSSNIRRKLVSKPLVAVLGRAIEIASHVASSPASVASVVSYTISICSIT
jgi:hypothetical protein